MLEDKQDALAQACKRHAVTRMYVFGSALGDDYRPGSSDIDLLVEFGPLSPHELADAYFDLLDELRAVLGVPIDLVMADAVKNRFIAADIDRTKRLLYAA
jgi:predicted nucleotidyltransferase